MKPNRSDANLFTPLRWSDAGIGNIVYLDGIKDSDFHAYGPHIVTDTIRRTLVNSQGNTFTQCAEVLLIEK